MKISRKDNDALNTLITINIERKDFEDKVKINKEIIDEQYEIEKSNYKIEETREIRQIITQDFKKANKFIELIKKGKSFDESKT